jgi:chaperone modulatory protein CbpM
MQDDDILAAAILEDACLTLEELASACAVSPDWVIRHVEEGILSSRGATVVEWRFTGGDLVRARHIHAIERDFEATPELAGLVADLLDEMDRLRARLRKAGLG